jgi:hypothetical protein
VLDVEAVQVCIDRDRELREHDAWLAGLSGRREPAVGAVRRHVTAFSCPECRLNFCCLDWDVHFAFTPESHDCVIGTCPNGHRHLLG